MDSEEDYGFSDEDMDDDEDVGAENMYYNSKGMLEEGETAEALDGFRNVVEMEKAANDDQRGEWGFKALKQVVKQLMREGRHTEMLEAYREMLQYLDGAVTRSAGEKKVNSLLDFVSLQAKQSDSGTILEDFYAATLEPLEGGRNERLWFKTTLKLCQVLLEKDQLGRLARTIKQLHATCQTEDGADDHKKGTQLLEVYAVEIQMYTKQKDTKVLKKLYQKALSVSQSAIPHPRIMGIIRECGGKMHMGERVWSEAGTDFFEAFKNYDEAGVARRIQCLKYLVLAYMLMESEVDPFDAQETKPYKNDSEILAMTNLIAAYQRNDITEFESILKNNQKTIMDDAFIRQYIEDLLRKIRTQVLLELVKPYTSVRLPFISSQLNIPEKDVEALLIHLILDGKVKGKVDQVNATLQLQGAGGVEQEKYASLEKWGQGVGNLHAAVCRRVSAQT